MIGRRIKKERDGTSSDAQASFSVVIKFLHCKVRDIEVANLQIDFASRKLTTCPIAARGVMSAYDRSCDAAIAQVPLVFTF